MGMFDTVRSSYPLGDEFQGELQTKTIDDYLGGSMSQYWISPNGQLFYMDYSGTSEFYEDEEATHLLLRLKTRPTGQKGRVRPERLTKSITVYPESYNGEWKDWPEVTIFFVNGILQSTYSNVRHSQFHHP